MQQQPQSQDDKDNSDDKLEKAGTVKSKISSSKSQEMGNSITHFIGAGLAIASYPLLIIKGNGSALNIISYIIFSTSALILFSMSGVFHLINIFKNEKAKEFFQVLDHSSIFILIAGTYTPIIMLSANSLKGYIVLLIEWLLTFIGIFIKFKMIGKKSIIATTVSIIVYLTMGWLCLVVLQDISKNISLLPMVFLWIMGLSYSLGVIFYIFQKIPFMHFVFHLFVLSGAVFSFFSIYLI